MEWEIPEALDIRPCEKPSEFRARQLNMYPVRLKKLPQWVDNAAFQIQTPLNDQISPRSPQKQFSIETQFFSSINSKYKNKEKFTLIYEKGEEKYVFNQNFTYEYVSSNYSELDEWKETLSNFRYQQVENQKVNTGRAFYEQKNSQKSQKGKQELIFESRFECGNLSKVYQVNNNPNEYHLMLQNDINTLGYNQWYAFEINNSSDQTTTIELRIVNFVKSSSLYKKGMKPWCISERSCSWRPIKDACTYKKTNVKMGDSEYFSELAFMIDLLPGLTMISMMPIYSYSRICSKIEKWKSIKGMKIYPKKVYSLINNIVPVLEYTPYVMLHLSKWNQEFYNNEEEIKWYDTIVVFARTHPGEVWSSFLMEEFIETIIHYHKSNYAKFRYLILPMINPDGVIYGNFRCDFSGVDLNRVWIQPSKFTQPSIYSIKKILAKQFENKKAKYFIDLHSHSKALNVFAYTSAQTLMQSRLVSDLIRLSDQNKIFDPIKSSIGLNKEFFIQSQTTFLSSKQIQYSSKKSTARAFMSKLTERGKSMTIEISFFGYENKKSPEGEINPFSVRDFNDLSWCLLKKIHDFINFKEEVILAKKMLQPIYNAFYENLYANESTTTAHSSTKKQTKQIENRSNGLSSDSDSEPEKYYTSETKKIIKQKNGQVYEHKVPQKSVLTRKGYLKHTEAMIKRIEVIKKDKSSSVLGNDYKKLKMLSEAKQQQNLSLPFKNEEKQSPHKKPSFSDYVSKSHCDLPPSTIERSKQIQSETKIQSSCMIGQKTSSMRKKLILQSKRKDFKFSKQNKEKDSGSKYFDPAVGNAIKSIIEPVIIEADDSKTPEPTFGKFLTKNKRNVSRRYKTLVKEDVNNYKNQLSKMYSNNSKEPNHKKIKLQTEVTRFLEDKIYSEESSLMKFQAHLPKSKIAKESQLILSRPEKKESVKKHEESHRKKSKKGSGLDKIHNYKNKYLIERKKIVEMMKKQTRFYHEYEKDAITAEDIEEIIEKRKRTHTEIQKSKNYFEDSNIFYENKIGTIKNSQPSTKAFYEIFSSAKKQFPLKKQYQQRQLSEKR